MTYDPTALDPRLLDRMRQEDEEAASLLEEERDRNDRFDDFGEAWLTSGLSEAEFRQVSEDIRTISEAAFQPAPKENE